MLRDRIRLRETETMSELGLLHSLNVGLPLNDPQYNQ